jgi:putative endopeptidase
MGLARTGRLLQESLSIAVMIEATDFDLGRTAMKRTFTGILCMLAGAFASAQADDLRSGIDQQYVDSSVRPQDDFYRYVNGKWLDEVPIPADRARYGTFDILNDQSREQLHGILEGLQTVLNAGDPDQPKLADLYASFMDEKRVEKLQLKPLREELARVDAMRSKNDIPALIAHFNRIGITAPYGSTVQQDSRDSGRYVFEIGQDGLGLPDRDYYLSDDARLRQVRDRYLVYMGKMLQMAGEHHADQAARDVLALETALAGAQWPRTENRNPIKVYNKFAVADLGTVAPGYDWSSYLSETVASAVDSIIVRQPSYITALNRIVNDTPLPVWKEYFRWHLLDDSAPLLNSALVDTHFAFHGNTVRGIEQNEPRWKRGVALVEGSMGEALGRLYVARYFSADAKARAQRLVANLLDAYRQDLQTLDWMGPETREKAQQKLAKFGYKIGYPDKWRDYGTLKIVKNDLFGNSLRANVFEYERNLHKLGKPFDRTEWLMTPQTVNAYYQPTSNEIVFPAAILRPPYFDPGADDAVNYGSIGGVIGHEISHGFDDQGSQFDGDGNLLNPPGWFTQADLDQFNARTHVLVEQYAAYEPVPGFHVNGELTLGENIADNSGLSIAHKAYLLSLAGQPSPVIDSLTGDQRFYMGWAQVWRGKTRDDELIQRIKTDPHSPLPVRGTAPERNQAPFYDAFDIKPGDRMYLPPAQRVSLW